MSAPRVIFVGAALAVIVIVVAVVMSTTEIDVVVDHGTPAPVEEHVPEAGLSGAAAPATSPQVAADTPWRALIDGFADRPRSPHASALIERARRDPSLVQELVDALHSRHDGQRPDPYPEVADLWAALDAIGAPTAAAVGRALQQRDKVTEMRLVQLLMRNWADARAAVPGVITYVMDAERDPQLRGWLLSLLGSHRGASDAIVPWLHQELRAYDGELHVQGAAPGALWRISGDTPELRETFTRIIEDGGTQARQGLDRALSEAAGEMGGMLPPLRAYLHSRCREEARVVYILSALAYVRDEQPAALDLLQALIRDPDEAQHHEVAIGAMTMSGQEGPRRLVAMMSELPPKLRRVALDSLVNSTADAEFVELALGHFVDEGRLDDPQLLAHAARLGMSWAFLRAHVVPLLSDDTYRMRGSALAALVSCRDAGDAAIQALDAALGASSVAQRSGLLVEVEPRTIQSARMWSRIEQVIRTHPSDRVIEVCLQRFAALEPDDRSRVIPLLIKLVDDQRHRVAATAVSVLADYYDDAIRALPVLQRRLREAEAAGESTLADVLERTLVSWRRMGLY